MIAGNSIMQDRLFINRYFTRLAGKLHYRMLDVTAWKVMMSARFGIRLEKKKAHRALDDIRESLGEMRFYLEHVKPSRSAYLRWPAAPRKSGRPPAGSRRR